MYSDDTAVGKAHRYVSAGVPPAGGSFGSDVETPSPIDIQCRFYRGPPGVSLSPAKSKKDKENSILVHIPRPVSIRRACTLSNPTVRVQ